MMMDNFVQLAAGTYQGWTVQTSDHWWQFKPLSQSLTAHHPPRLPDLGTMRTSVSLSVGPGDPQWELIRAARNEVRFHPSQTVTATALEAVLARITTAVQTTAASSWLIQPWREPYSGIIAHAHSIAGKGTTVTVRSSLTDFRPDGLLAHHLQQRLKGGNRSEAFELVLATIQRLPNMPPAGTDWAAHTAEFLRRPLPWAPRIGQIQVVFTNAINGQFEKRNCQDLTEARRLAAEHRPFNNTRVDAYRVVSVDEVGTARVEPLDLDEPSRHDAVASPPAGHADAALTAPGTPPTAHAETSASTSDPPAVPPTTKTAAPSFPTSPSTAANQPGATVAGDAARRHQRASPTANRRSR